MFQRESQKSISIAISIQQMAQSRIFAKTSTCSRCSEGKVLGFVRKMVAS